MQTQRHDRLDPSGKLFLPPDDPFSPDVLIAESCAAVDWFTRHVVALTTQQWVQRS
jgi:hypothetical protein